jgi:outer membrane lipopolysaccharide assembly protein LptE/RlpB
MSLLHQHLKRDQEAKVRGVGEAAEAELRRVSAQMKADADRHTEAAEVLRRRFDDATVELAAVRRELEAARAELRENVAASQVRWGGTERRHEHARARQTLSL